MARDGCVLPGGSADPRLDHERQVLLLQLEQVPGIHSLLLNGQTDPWRLSPRSRVTKSRSTDLRDRNLLVLEVEPPVPELSRGRDARGVGHIALVIRPDSPGDARASAVRR